MTTANDLITNAYYLSGVRAINFETPTSSEIASGLQLLNGILGESSINAGMIPYFTHLEFDTVVGQQIYPIEGLIELSALTYNIGNVRFPMIRDSINRFFATGRVDDINSLPFHFFPERALNSMNIYLYFVPDQIFQMKITGKFVQTTVSNFTNLDPLYDQYYQKWLKYRLAAEICELNEKDFNPQSLQRLNNLERRIFREVGTDLTVSKYNFMGRRVTSDPWGQANLGKGWTTP